MRGYRYNTQTETTMPTLTPIVVDSNTLPPHSQAEGSTNDKNCRARNDGPTRMMAGTAVERCPRDPY